MKIIGGVIPCKDRFFLDKALLFVKAGIEELAGKSNGEVTYYDVALQLYSGNYQLYMIYDDKESNTTENQEQAVVIAKVLNGDDAAFVGFLILQFQQTAFHIFMAYSLPQFRHDSDIVGQSWAKVIKQAKLYGAPYISLCTSREFGEMVKRNGFVEQYTHYRLKL